MSESVATQESFFGSPAALGPSNGKRRQPPTGFSAGPAYGAKTRRREEGLPTRRSGPQWAAGGEREGGIRLQKDELIDGQLVERIRNGELLYYWCFTPISIPRRRLGRSFRRVLPQERQLSVPYCYIGEFVFTVLYTLLILASSIFRSFCIPCTQCMISASRCTREHYENVKPALQAQHPKTHI